jgi:hypothetical protein
LDATISLTKNFDTIPRDGKTTQKAKETVQGRFFGDLISCPIQRVCYDLQDRHTVSLFDLVPG